jgi:HAD superfamily hydrolase (TIGR01549 family)
MIKALLLDLDDTLLGNNTQTFMERYFALLGEYARPVFDQAVFLPALIRSTQATISNIDPALTNAEVFWANFEELTGGRRTDLEPFFRRFYETEFPRLRSSVAVRPAAAELIQAAQRRGLAVVIATNPLFPFTAIEQRLEWAGIPVTLYPYALVTAYENMHATKPQPDYYREILDLIGRTPEEALMAGDDWKNDIAPATKAGLHTYWITNGETSPPDPAMIRGQGTLDELARIVIDGDLNQLVDPRSPEF